jgi:D-sedoheptulose 7-phosphate isomerase
MLADDRLTEKIVEVSECITSACRTGHKVLLAGNGGSAADAQHIAGELVSRFRFDRPGIAAIALTTDTSVLTATGNDYGYARVFERQLQAVGSKGDVFIGISTSGKSDNILRAFAVCREKGILSVGLTGNAQGGMEMLCDICLQIPSAETPRIQEAHILVGHIICCMVEESLFGELNPEHRW